MSKGLKAALMTVAVAMIGLKAMAIAPTVTDVPDVVVGNEGQATASSVFVYPDAINLDNYVSDDSTADADIKWSFTGETGKGIYQLNGIDANTDLSVATIVNPGAKDISKNLATGELNQDNNLRTVTIRNKHLSPLTGTGAAAVANDKTSPVNHIDAETEMLTLFASDGTTCTTGKPFFVYTDNGGNDRPVPTDLTWTQEKTVDFNSGVAGFTYQGYGLGGASSTNGGKAICLDCNAAENYAEWNGAYGMFTVAKNTVYRIRVTMNSTNVATSASEQNPLWDILLDNSTGTGGNLFYFDNIVFDNFGGGGNTILSSAPKVFDFYFAPAAINSAKWNDATSGAFITANATKIQTRLTFRVLDLTGNAGIHAGTAKGVLCLDNVQVDSVPFDALVATGTQPEFNLTSLDATKVTCSTIWTAAADMTVPTYSGGVMTIQPKGQGITAGEYTQVVPGNAITAADWANPTNGNLLDNYPVVWTDSTVYKVSYTVSRDESKTAPGFLSFGMDTMDSNFITLNYVTNAMSGLIMPTATATDFVTFCSPGTTSPDIAAAYRHLRPRFELGNNNFVTGAGDIKIHGIKVEKVKVN